MAGTSIGSTALYLSADASEFQKGLDHAEKLFRAYAAKTKAESAALNKQVKSSFGFGDILRTAAGVAGGLGLAGGISKISSILPGIVGDSIKLAASVEDTATDFRVMVGDAKTAASLFADIRDFAAKTPLTGSDLSSAAKTLLSIGVAADQIVPTLRVLGDLAGGQGEKLKSVAMIYGQIRTEGKLSGENLKQLGENGIVIVDELARVLRVSKAELAGLASDGKIGFSDFQRAIAAATGEGGRFFGLMEARSKTFNGLLSTLQDNWEQLLAGFGQLVIDEFGLKGVLDKLAQSTDLAKGNLEGMRPIVREIAEWSKKAARELYEGGFAFARLLAQAKDDLGDVREEISGLRQALGIGMAARALTLFGEVVSPGSSYGPAPKGGAADQVDRLKRQLDKIWDLQAPEAAGKAVGRGLVEHLAAFAKAERQKFQIEKDGLYREMLKQVQGLREGLDPVLELQRHLKELGDIRKRGGFHDEINVDMGNGQGWGGRNFNDDLWAFAIGGLFKKMAGSVDFQKQVGIATAGSSEAVGAVINAQNAGMIRPEDKVVAAINAQKAIQQAQLRLGQAILKAIENRQIPAF